MVNVRSTRAKLLTAFLLLGLGLSGCSVFSTLGGWISHGYENTVAYFNAYYNAKRLFDDAEAEVLAAHNAMRTKALTANPVTQGPQGANPFGSNPAGANPFSTNPGGQIPAGGYPAGTSPTTGFQTPGNPATGFPASSNPTPGYPNPANPAGGYPTNPNQTPGLPSAGYPNANQGGGYNPQASLAPQASSTAKQKFGQVIDKCSNILSFYPTSSVVDDALFLIGKSYYYQDEFMKADRKFTELISHDPSGSLALEAQLWWLKTLQKLNRFEDAVRVGDALISSATDAKENDIAGQAGSILGDIAVTQNDPTNAIDRYTKSVSTADDGALKATTQSKLGDLYVALQDYEKASVAYRDVEKYSPDAYALYYSKLHAALAERSIHHYDDAIALLKELQSDYRFLDFASTIRFEIGNTLAASGKFDEAVTEFRLIDTTYSRTEQGARAAFELGKLYQSKYGDYVDAKTSYSHAAVGGPPDLTQEAQRRAGALDKYFVLQHQFFQRDSLLMAIDIDSLWIRADTVTKIVADTLSSPPMQGQQTSPRDSIKMATVRDTTRGSRDSILAVKSNDSTRSKVVSRDSAFAGTRSDSARSAVRPRDSMLGTKLRDSSSSVVKEVVFRVVKPKKDSVLATMGNVALQMGELFNSDLNNPDSTYYWLDRALRFGLDSVGAPRALYVLAGVAESSADKKFGDEKDFYHRIIEKYPSSKYAEEARVSLGFQPTQRKEDPAKAVYAYADSLMFAGQYQAAIDSLRRLIIDYPQSPMAAKSMYTMAWIYEKNLDLPDSALTQFKTLASKYASSQYGVVAAGRIPPVAPPDSAASDSTKRGAVQVPGKAAVDAAGKPRPDSTMKGPAPSLVKPPADTTGRPVNTRPILPDSSAVKDTSRTRRARAVHSIE